MPMRRSSLLRTGVATSPAAARSHCGAPSLACARAPSRGDRVLTPLALPVDAVCGLARKIARRRRRLLASARAALRSRCGVAARSGRSGARLHPIAAQLALRRGRGLPLRAALPGDRLRRLRACRALAIVRAQPEPRGFARRAASLPRRSPRSRSAARAAACGARLRSACRRADASRSRCACPRAAAAPRARAASRPARRLGAPAA